MRHKKCIYDMMSHIDQEIGCCEYCDEKATHLTMLSNLWGRGWRLLCKKHYHEWIKGDLYI